MTTYSCFGRRPVRVLLVLAAAATAVISEAAEQSDEPVRCVSLSRVQSLDILSNKQIVFELSGGEYYVNNLPYPCPGLRRSSTLMYRTSIGRLCNVDVVTLLESVGGGLMPGASCGLGMFEPTDKKDVEALRALARDEDFH
ncbi:MAG: hypothetical protein HKO62_12755 [Gammaproteobacteria bacterium]|nr:hypothetical protein [Gammaproteobacteria bacterium]NNM01615.1 hypothetical protein [Gammaproteobacteria bacterium]